VQVPPDALGFAVVVATLFASAFGVKFLVWGKGPIRRIRGGGEESAVDERLIDLEERVQRLSEIVRDQALALDDYHERLDFAERVISQRGGDEPNALKPPDPVDTR
jgi:hypothetical protein